MKNLVVNNIGVMQGRLLPKFQKRFQAFPVYSWSREFKLAKSFKLKNIEFIFDYYLYRKNPLFNLYGIKKIKYLSKKTSIYVHSICADYYMEKPIFSEGTQFLINKIVFKTLIKHASFLGVKEVIIPCVDNSSLDNEQKKSLAIRFLNQIDLYLKKYKINIALETDLNPLDFINFIKKINSKNIRVNYDIGNSASLGFDMHKEIKSYGHLISNIHVKDRKLNGGSCILGTGDANLEKFFSYLQKIPKNYLLIMQCYRDDEGVSIFKDQLKYLKRVLNGKRYF